MMHSVAALVCLLACAASSAAPEHALRLSGRFEYRTDDESRNVLGDQVCFHADAQSAARVPRDKSDTRQVWFCFRETPDAMRKLGIPRKPPAGSCGFKGDAVVEISDYSVSRTEGDDNDVADLNLVLKKFNLDRIECR